MIKIEVEGESLDLSPGTKVRFELISPLFDFSSTPGLFSFPIEFPSTSRNKRLFKYAHRVARIENVQEIDCKVYIGGLLFLQGHLKIIESGKVFKSSIFAGAGDFAKNVGDKLLPDLDLGGERLIAPTQADFIPHLNSTIQSTYPDADYVFFPYLNARFAHPFDGSNNAWKNVVNYFINGSFAPNVFGGFGINYLLATPFLYLLFLLEEVFKEGGYKMARNKFANDPEIRSLVLLSNEAISDLSVFPTPTYPSSYDFSNGLPRVRVQTLINHFRILFNLGLFFSLRDQTAEFIPWKEIIQSTPDTDWTSYVLANSTVQDIENETFAFQFETDPEDGLQEEYTPSLMGFNIIEPVITIDDLTVLAATRNDLVLVQDRQQWWLFEGSIWVFHSYNFHGDEPLGNPEPMETQLSPFAHPQITLDLVNGGREWLIPEVEIPGNYMAQTYINGSLDSYLPRLCFYRGLQPDSNGDTYPMGSTGVYNFNGDQVGKYALDWISQHGLKETWWKDWLSFRSKTRKQTSRVLLPLDKIINLNLARKIRMDGVNYLIGKATIQVSTERIDPVIFELYTV